MIQLQPRDYQILRLCYEHQFLTAQAVQSLFEKSSYTCASRRLKELNQAGLINRAKSQILGKLFLFRLSLAGRRIAEESGAERVSQTRGVNLATLVHDTLVIEARNRILKVWNATFVCERLIKQVDYKELPDGLFVFESGKVVALELENSDKGKTRFETLLLRWDQIRQVSFVLYVVSNAKLSEVVKRYITNSRTTQPIGVVTIDELRAGTPTVWTVKGPIPLLERSPF